MSLRSATALVVVLLGVASAGATPPIYHGTLVLRPTVGSFNRRTGVSTVRARDWQLDLADNSRGIDPANEQIVISLGSNNNFRVPLAEVRVRRHGTLFLYRRVPAAPTPGVTWLRMRRISPKRYRVSFTLKRLDLSALIFDSDQCVPMAIIVGQNDGFSGVELTRGARALDSSTVEIAHDCLPDNGWPWLQGQEADPRWMSKRGEQGASTPLWLAHCSS